MDLRSKVTSGPTKQPANQRRDKTLLVMAVMPHRTNGVTDRPTTNDHLGNWGPLRSGEIHHVGAAAAARGGSSLLRRLRQTAKTLFMIAS